MQPTILVVEDEKDILDLVDYNLQQAGFKVLRTMNGLEAMDLVKTQHLDLVVLDLMLPGLDGKEVCRRMRQDESTRDVPVLMLTARAEEVDRIIGFEIGADDYLTKPFSPRELVLRIQAIIRRMASRADAPAKVNLPGFLIDLEKHRVEVDGQDVVLTATEYNLLRYLATRPGRVQSRETLLDEVWGYSYAGYNRTVDSHIRRLRSKLGSQKDRIETVRGFGYRFKED